MSINFQNATFSHSGLVSRDTSADPIHGYASGVGDIPLSANQITVTFDGSAYDITGIAGWSNATIIAQNGSDSVLFQNEAGDAWLLVASTDLADLQIASGGIAIDSSMPDGTADTTFNSGYFKGGDSGSTSADDWGAPLTGPVCFLSGTRILTRAGYHPVESLAVGDEILTMNHGWQPVRWLGVMERGKHFGSFRKEDLPIRIVRDAFGPDLPARDLRVSPQHAVFFRDHLIPAERLVNGETVIRDESVETIQYYHVLLDRHAVIFSEGLPTESYVPQENLESFDNSATCPQELRKDIVVPIGIYSDCYPRALQGSVVETARAVLARNLANTAKRAAA